MKYYNYFLIVFFSILSQACGSNDDLPALEDAVSLKITSFETSYNEVKISWDLERFNNQIIIKDLTIIRYTNDADADNENRQQIIANLPSNETSFIDTEVPYLEGLTYKIEVNYFIDGFDKAEYESIESEEKVFERDIIKFPYIPNHIVKDTEDPNSYHIMIKNADFDLYRYNTKTQKIEANKKYHNGYLFYDKIVANNNDILVGNKNGVIYQLTSTDYTQGNSFSVPIEDELKSFGVKGTEIHYNDNRKWKYFNSITSDFSTVNDSFVSNFVYSLNMENNKMLIINNNYPNYWGTIYDISTYDQLEVIHTTDFSIDFGSRLDKGILHFKQDKTEFITSIFGRVISMNDLSLKIELKEVTGRNYLYFNYGNNGKLYGAVQDEKVIHVFDDKTYELIESIETKLYPVFPIVSDNGEVHSIGRYTRIGYWSYTDGFELYGSNSNYAIETF